MKERKKIGAKIKFRIYLVQLIQILLLIFWNL